MQYPIVHVPQLIENDFGYGADDAAENHMMPTNYAIHHSAGTFSINVFAYSTIFNLYLIGFTYLGTVPAYEYYDPIEEMQAFLVSPKELNK
jgi:hypothetical protein